MASTPFMRAFSPVNKQSGDTKWKNYAANVEQSMKGWDSIEVWADYVFYLQKLGKALRTSPTNNHHIPHAKIISQRLSVCLQPHISSGVHLRAIEVYNIIFDILSDRLSSEIGAWFPGMAPILGHTDTTTMRPAADLFKRFIDTLPTIRALLRSLLLSLLSGLEDESSEIFTDVFKMVDDVKLKVNDDAHFWQCFFLAVISSPERRMGALSYANRKFPKFQQTPEKDVKRRESAFQLLDYEAQMAINPDPGLMIRAFCVGLQDANLLVQRGFMELLVQRLHLDSVALQFIADKKDLQMLCIAACSTVLKREMSLNRRLWSWLLGPDPEAAEETTHSRSEYFGRYGCQHLIDGLLQMMAEQSSDPALISKPYRICVSILDRWEIGGAVVPKVFIPAVRSVKYFCDNYSQGSQEVLNSCGAFFDATETINIGHDLLQLVLSLDHENFELLDFILNNFHVADDELKSRHLPLTLLSLLLRHEELPKEDNWSEIFVKLCERLIEVIPNFVAISNPSNDGIPMANILEKIEGFYKQANDTDAETGSGPFSDAVLTDLILKQLTALVVEHSLYYGLLAQLLVKIPGSGSWRCDKLVLKMVETGDGVQVFGLVHKSMSTDEVDGYVAKSLKKVWDVLSSPNSAFPIEAVRNLWEIQEALDDSSVESGLASLLCQCPNPIVTMRAFSRIWAHSVERANFKVVLTRLVFMVLDNIGDEQWAVYINTWLENVVQQRSTIKLFSVLIDPILTVSYQDDVLLFKYHVNVLNSVLDMNPQLRQCYFKDRFTDDTAVEAKVNHALMNYLSDSSAPRAALVSCVGLLDNTIFDTAHVTKVLMNLLTDFNGTNMDEIAVLKLLSKCLSKQTDAGVSVDELKGLILGGLSNAGSNEYVVEAWVRLLCESLKVFDTSLLHYLMDLSSCLMTQINKVFDAIKAGWGPSYDGLILTAYSSYADGLEALLVYSHEQLQHEERRASVNNSNYHQHHRAMSSQLQQTTNNSENGFFGTVMSGVFAVESPIAKSQAANTRLTVLTAFQDATRVGYSIWRWTDTVSKQRTIASDSNKLLFSRLRYRMRGLLVRLYNLEPLETCERLIQLGLGNEAPETKHVCKLIHIIDGGRPKVTIPYLFEALSSRVNSDAPDHVNPILSSLTTRLSENDLAKFLNEYLSRIDNDAMEDIWTECIGFVTKEVIPNHSLYRPVLPHMLTFICIMAEKLSRIKFGDQRKVKRDLSEAFSRVLGYSLNSKNQISELTGGNRSPTPAGGSGSSRFSVSLESENSPEDLLVSSLFYVVPKLPVLQDANEKQASSISVIMANVFSPLAKSKAFPSNMSVQMVRLLGAILNVPNSVKSWKSVVGDLIFDQRFLEMTRQQAKAWEPVVGRWAQYDKDRVKEYLSRLSSHGSTSSFINWSDSETTNRQANLNRLAYLLLCGPDTAYGLDAEELVTRLDETHSNDPQTLGHVCLVLRAMVLSISKQHLNPIWTTLPAILLAVFSELLEPNAVKTLDLSTLTHACKLLDVLLCVGYEEFRLQEWLFICDNMKAIFKDEVDGGALETDCGMIIDSISSRGPIQSGTTTLEVDVEPSNKNRPLLCGKRVGKLSELKPFFDQLSMVNYEQLYNLEGPDIEACKRDLVDDIFV